MKETVSNHYSITEDDSIKAVVKFTNGDTIKIKCIDYYFDDNLVCIGSNNKAVFTAPREQVVCVFNEKYRTVG